jgi:hypothetical protein
MPRYPDVVVPLSGLDGMTASILGRVERTMKREGIDHLWPSFLQDSAGDYQSLLDATRRWFATE